MIQEHNAKGKIVSDAITDDQEFGSEPHNVEREREAVLHSVAGGKLDTLQERVAWVLNHYPDARDSDITLQLRYWELFESDLTSGTSIDKADLYRLARLTSLARARAKIQNTYKLFQASPEVQSSRGTLAEEEREKAAEQKQNFPAFAVYADESGKTGKYLIVGSVWFLHPPEIISFIRTVWEWREKTKFDSELHFKTISKDSLPHYLSFADLLSDHASVLSFKAVSVPRPGLKSVDDAVQELYYHLLVRGIEHEHDTGRAPFPRTLQVWKDLEEPGRDKLFLTKLDDRLRQASASRFDDRLSIDTLEPIESRGQVLVQVADLYTSSINRVLNAEGKRKAPKDQFAEYLLGLLDLPQGPTSEESVGDMSVHITL